MATTQVPRGHRRALLHFLWDPTNTPARAGGIVRLAKLLWRHRDDPAVARLLDHLWIYRAPARAILNPTRAVVQRPIRESHDRLPDEIPPLYCSHLTSRPLWPDDHVTELLERNLATIKRELATIDPTHYKIDRRDSDLTARGWEVFPLYDGFGRRNEANCARCPGTAAVVEQVPGAGKPGFMAYFSIMQPGTHVRLHTSATNTRLRYHLGLEVPDGVYLRLHDRIETWRQDACIVFDDSYQHEVFQQADRRRVVFILDAPHPELTPPERTLISDVIATYLAEQVNEEIYRDRAGAG